MCFTFNGLIQTIVSSSHQRRCYHLTFVVFLRQPCTPPMRLAYFKKNLTPEYNYIHFLHGQSPLCTNWPGKKCLDSCRAYLIPERNRTGRRQEEGKNSVYLFVFLHELVRNKCLINHFLLSDETFWLCHRILIEK